MLSCFPSIQLSKGIASLFSLCTQGPCFTERGAPLYTIDKPVGIAPSHEKVVASLVGIASVDGDCHKENSVFVATDFQKYLPWITELMLRKPILFFNFKSYIKWE